MKLWITWVLTTFLIGAASEIVPDVFVLGLPSYNFAGDNAIGPGILWGCPLLIGLGPLLGLAQGLILLRLQQYQDWKLWAGATAIGVLLAAVVNVIVNVKVSPGVGLLLPGAVIGMAQWLVLRRSVPAAQWWPMTSTLAWLVSGAVGWIAFMTLFPAVPLGFPFYPADSALRWAVSWAVGTLVFASITGLALVWLLRSRRHP